MTLELHYPNWDGDSMLGIELYSPNNIELLKASAISHRNESDMRGEFVIYAVSKFEEGDLEITVRRKVWELK